MFTEADYDKLKQMMEESPEKKELLSRLLAHHQAELSALSHEIRNPLTLIYSTLQLIETQHPEVLTYTHWNALHQDIEYTNQLLEELSAYNNSMQLSPQDIQSEGFLKSVVLSFAASLAETDIEFTSRIEPGLPDICADATKLRQVLLNLLKNAREAVTAQGYPNNQSLTLSSPAIFLHAYVHNSFLLIEVTDNGCGIPPEIRNSIFEPFVTHKEGGTGLGLPIARRIAEAHGGSLTVSSAPDSGSLAPSSAPDGLTIFTLSLPI